MTEPATSQRLFTVEQANSMLPLVRAITRDLMLLARDVADRRQRVESLTAGRELSPHDPYLAELAEVERDLDRDRERLRDYVRELRELGVEAKGAIEGLVDFPTKMDGQPAFLCWQYGEPEVMFWHSVSGGFAGRQPLLAGAAADESSLGQSDEI